MYRGIERGIKKVLGEGDGEGQVTPMKRSGSYRSVCPSATGDLRGMPSTSSTVRMSRVTSSGGRIPSARL